MTDSPDQPSGGQRPIWWARALASVAGWLFADTGLGPAGARMSGLGLLAFVAMLAFGAAWAVAPLGEEALFQTLYFVSLGTVVVDLAVWAWPVRRR